MADADSTRECPVCGAAIHPKINKDGLPRKGRPAMLCSRRCYFKQRDAARPPRVGSSGPRAYRDAECRTCAAPFQSYPTGSTWTVHCSRACSGAAQTERAGGGVAGKAAVKRVVRAEVLALRRIARHVESPRTFRIKCKICDGSLIARRNGGKFRVVCVGCVTQGKRTSRRIGKGRRRATERGAASERIDPIKVFERDKWRCHLCRAKTPQKLRGTHDPRAPELDHIVTLADGGAHTWGNVACACRQCNCSKGATSRGQLGLGLAA